MRKLFYVLTAFVCVLTVLGFLFPLLSFSSETPEISFDRLHIRKDEPKCDNLLKENKDSTEVQRAQSWRPSIEETFTDNRLRDTISQSCTNFLKNKKYFLHRFDNKEERDFRIAFSIVVFKNASQIERLLRVIYRPWNYYCIHVDTKSDKEFFKAIEELVKCLNSKYNNIINTENRVDVVWGRMSVLTADLNCMRELYERYKDWKYLINLTGQEFPLKTNAELVKILKAYKGSNNLEGTYKRRNEDRVSNKKIPFPIVWYKGSVHITVNRDFVAFVFESNKSKILLDVLQQQSFPDEQFFSTLNHNPILRIPGSFIGDPDEDVLNYFLTRYKNWGHLPCNSRKYVRLICIWGVADLPQLVKASHLFANKFYEEFQPATLRCLERWYYDKVERELKTGNITVNQSFYSSLSFVKYRYIPPSD